MRLIAPVISAIAAALFVAGVVSAVTTISTNIVTDGNLSVTGTSSFEGNVTFADGVLLDLSAILHDDTATQGLLLPNAASATPSNPASGEGYLAWDTAGNQLVTYNGSAWSAVGGSISIGDAIGSSTAGSVLFVDSSANLAQDNDNFFWDDTNNRLGIGTTGPTELVTIASATSPTMSLLRDDGTIIQDELLGIIRFKGTDSAGLGAAIAASAAAEWTSSIVVPGYLSFFTTSSASGGTSLERMRIDEDGNVGIGTTDPSTTLDVDGTFRANNGTRILKRVSAAQSATTCATSDTTINGATFTVPANSLSTNKGLRFTALVTIASVGAGDDIRMDVDFGGTDIVALDRPGTLRGRDVWTGTIYNRDSASSQIAYAQYDPEGNVASQLFSGTATVDTTSNVTFALQCHDADAASNGDDDTVTLDMLIIEELGTD